jgi:serine/threonine protein kinase
MGEVYRARDTRLDRDVALKILNETAAGNADRRARFEREARAVAALNHPNIVAIYDVGSEDGASFIVSELVAGESLRARISRGHLAVRELLKIAVQIADGLAGAHSAGFVHRDLKPENIMLTTDGRVKVLDFGLAKLTDAADASEDDETRTERAVTEEGSVVGSAPYMSPEQAEGRKLDARSDIFSLGSVLYEMLTGKRRHSAAPTARPPWPPFSRRSPSLHQSWFRICRASLSARRCAACEKIRGAASRSWATCGSCWKSQKRNPSRGR